MKKEQTYFDVIVVGTGISGLYTALSLDEKLNVLIISKGKVKNCNTIRAEGGMAASIGPGDSPLLHAQDTIAAGGGLNDSQVVDIFASEVVDRIKELENMGFRFDRDESGNYILGLEGFHSVRRILHHNGDKIGEGIFTFLLKYVNERKNIKILEDAYLSDIFLDEDNSYCGIQVQKNNEFHALSSKFLVLGSGGYAGIFKKSTNDPFVIGDILAISYKTGAIFSDLEFVQFHPTVLFKEGFEPFLISEAVRGEGAILINSKGDRFMGNYHPKGELASRDIVSKAIYEEMRKQKSKEIYLDMSLIGKTKIKKLFPNIYENCKIRGIDVTKDKILIHPAAHYTMGGIKTNIYGETSINGIFAVGEVSCNGLHGANRLASNSLPEALVFGKRIAQKINMGEFGRKKEIIAQNSPIAKFESRVLFPDKEEIRENNWKYLSIERKGEDLKKYKAYLEPYFIEALNSDATTNSPIYSYIILSYLVTTSALLREESRGSHFRVDFPNQTEDFRKSICLKRSDDTKDALPIISDIERR
jgi:L-aspartate oxidase